MLNEPVTVEFRSKEERVLAEQIGVRVVRTSVGTCPWQTQRLAHNKKTGDFHISNTRPATQVEVAMYNALLGEVARRGR